LLYLAEDQILVDRLLQGEIAYQLAANELMQRDSQPEG
jgi:hypothetical protein